MSKYRDTDSSGYTPTNSISNRNYIINELLPILDINEEEMKEKEESWVKSKIRNLKLKIINN